MSWNHPYFRLLHRALEGQGVRILECREIGVSWLRANRKRLDALHFHWPETVWRHRGRGIAGAAVRFRELLRFARFLREARRLGIACVWTVHNLEPHEDPSFCDRVGYWLIARSADLVVGHSNWSLSEVHRQYGVRGRSVVMPMGALHAAFPPPRPREVVMRELGLDPHLPMVSCAGRLREYKGFDLACAAIERLSGQVQLVVAGVPHPGFDLEPLQQAVSRITCATLLVRKLSDQEFADITAASDAVLLPYRHVTGSAALLTALGFGRAVIAADLPYFRELLAGAADAALLVAGTDAAAWSDAITGMLSRPADTRRQAALNLADHYSWERCIGPFVEALADTASRGGRWGQPVN
jgi:glycosyltransferase involved in cell wall biosynthesis